MKLVREILRTVRAVVDAALADVHTHIPAQVISYNATDNTVSVKPCINRIRTDDPNNATTVELPVISDVPVQQFGSGDLLFTVAPAADSYGTLHIAERELEQWLTKGGIVDPGSSRKFDISDAIFYPGVYPIGDLSAAVNTDRIEMRSLDGTKYLALKTDGKVYINSDAVDVDAAALASKVDDFISKFDTVMRTGWVVAAQDGGAALKTAYTTTFATAPSTVESVDLKVKQ